MFKDSTGIENLSVQGSRIRSMMGTCNGCGICQKECAFLTTYGNPGTISRHYETDPDKWRMIAFECSLCGLCTSVCPKGLDPDNMFLDFRKQAVNAGLVDFSIYQGPLDYEKKGTSKRYTYYSLPEACDTVFFPGCTLTGTRPDATQKTYDYLKKHDPGMGMVLDCCSKPSHDLGRQNYFDLMFSEMKGFLFKNSIKKVIVACPNCYKIFSTFGDPLKVETVYDVMARHGLDDHKLAGSIALHDPCPVRNKTNIHESVRSLVQARGLDIMETAHTGKDTFCCGEGGAVGCVSPGFAAGWADKRATEALPHKIVTYCAGCVNHLSKKADAFHVLDLVFDPDNALKGKAKVSKAPFTYLNRLKVKRDLKKIPAATTRERLFTADAKKENRLGPKLFLALAILAAIAGMRAAGIHEYLDQEKLSRFVQESGNAAPIIYMLIYSLAPALFLPGLPISLVGGILFGPLWGVIYTILGATTGAAVAFLISRYISGGFLESKLTGLKWIKFQDNVEKQGWKVVALTRLIPLFPFNLLNYAFGLTRIKFTHYIIATFICMLPGCIAFIVFPSSLPDLLKGKLSKEFIIGLVLMVMVSLIPVIYKKIKTKKGI
ncbi:MAG: VTT domain-containing protein [Proteobacteria bacterium]|nr:VTT domain-containing protein [Pseudomonadota bacterium]